MKFQKSDITKSLIVTILIKIEKLIVDLTQWFVTSPVLVSKKDIEFTIIKKQRAAWYIAYIICFQNSFRLKWTFCCPALYKVGNFFTILRSTSLSKINVQRTGHDVNIALYKVDSISLKYIWPEYPL